MTRKTKTVKQEVVIEATNVDIIAQTNRDSVNAVLIVSLMVNLFVLIAWIALQVTTAYDTQVASFLFAR